MDATNRVPLHGHPHLADYGDPFAVQERERLDRGLPRASLAAIGASGTIGVGIFITSGQSIAIAGTLGTLLAYIVSSVIIACVMITM
jgi:amino acid permease